MEHTAGLLGLVQEVQKKLSKRTKTERKWKGERVSCVSMERKNGQRDRHCQKKRKWRDISIA